MNKWKRVVVGLGAAMLLIGAAAVTPVNETFTRLTNLYVTADVEVGDDMDIAGDLYIAGALDVGGAASASTGAFTTLSASGALTLGTGLILPTATAASLTSPTVAFSVTGAYRVKLNSDGNQTGHYPTGGALNQVIQIESGTGSNTMRFDDGTSMAIGANITLTEGQYDVLTLLCISADGDDWVAISAHDN